MKVPYLDLAAQHAPLLGEIENAIRSVVAAGAFSSGPFVTSFERQFANYCRCEHGVGVGSGTEALWLSLIACGIGPGDEVITTPATFMATAEAISYCGAKPVFVDISEETYTLDPKLLPSVLTNKTKAIIPVHLYGQTADMDPILDFARKHGLFVIEDACQAHGASYRGRTAGSMGDAGCFSFYPSKNLGSFGEAGAVVTNSSALAEKVRMLQNHGQVRKNDHSVIGWNCRMDGIQAAVLGVKLGHLERWNEARRERAAIYFDLLRNTEKICLPVEASYGRHVYHVYPVRTSRREQLLAALDADGIGHGIHYPIPIHLQEAYRSLGYRPGAFPVAERVALETVSLPMYPELTRSQVGEVAGSVRKAFCSAIAA